jgi:hypothetical protein
MRWAVCPRSMPSAAAGGGCIKACGCNVAYVRMWCASCQAVVCMLRYGGIASSEARDVCTGSAGARRHSHSQSHSCTPRGFMPRRARRRAYIARVGIYGARVGRHLSWQACAELLDAMPMYKGTASVHPHRPQFPSNEAAMAPCLQMANMAPVLPDGSFAAAALVEAFGSLGL